MARVAEGAAEKGGGEAESGGERHEGVRVRDRDSGVAKGCHAQRVLRICRGRKKRDFKKKLKP